MDVLSLALRSVPSEYAAPQAPLATSDQSSEPASSPQPTDSVSVKSPLNVLQELYTGVGLTSKQLLSTFGKYGISQFDPTGETFDPNLHEAMYAAPIPGKAPGTIVDTQKAGYMIKGRVLRAAQVGIVQEAR
jgi:molecular chaperone GrpE